VTSDSSLSLSLSLLLSLPSSYTHGHTHLGKGVHGRSTQTSWRGPQIETDHRHGRPHNTQHTTHHTPHNTQHNTKPQNRVFFFSFELNATRSLPRNHFESVFILSFCFHFFFFLCYFSACGLIPPSFRDRIDSEAFFDDFTSPHIARNE
jgi:hypothetical protein